MALVLPLLLLLSAVKADQFGDFSFTSDGAVVSITDYTGSGSAVVVPGEINSLPVTNIGDYAFSYGNGLTSVTIPASVTSIGQFAFFYCTGLTSVIIPAGVTSIGRGSFESCANLFQASFFGNAPAMGPSVFFGTASSFRVYYLSDKTGFTSPTWQGYPALVFPDPLILNDPASIGVHGGGSTTLSVTAIGTEPLAYQWYKGVSGTTTAPVGGNSSTFTTPALFATTPYWVKVTNATNPGGADSNTATVAIITAPDVKTGFPNYISGSSVTLTGTVNPNYSATTAQFEYGLTTSYGSTVSVVLAPNDGSTTQNIEAGLGGLQEGQTYHYRLIATNSAGTSVGDDMTLVPDERSNGFQFSIVDGTVTITRYFENSYDYVANIPATINGLPVTRIGEYAFNGRSRLDRVTIPNGVTSIGNMAFYFCLSLWSVSIPDSVISIGDGAFSQCPSLSNINIPNGGISIGNGAFLDCRLASITIPTSVTSIGGGAFSGNSGLTRATFMGNAPAMGVDVFAQSAMGFGIRYYGGAAGFTTPTWMGYPSLVGAPDMELEQAGLELTDGGVLNCGAVRTGTEESRLITIRNTGEHDLTGLVLSIDGTNSGNFAVGPMEKSTLVPGESTTFGVTFSPTAGGIRAASLHVARSASDANPFDVMLTGTGLSVTDGGAAPWTEQSTITHGGSAASRSGSITHSQESWIQTTVTGPGTLTFWWKVSSQSSADYLELYRDGNLQNRISGEVDWNLYAQNIPAGSHTVKWRYMKNATTTSGQDAGWVDDVVFLPASFAPVVDTGSATGITVSTATLNAVVNPNGTATTAQFQYGPSKDYGRVKSVTLSPNTGSTTVATSVNLSGLPPGWTYHYRLVATNASGTSLGADGTFATEASSGPFKFTMNDGAATISGYTGPGGAVSIPATINGSPVTGIGANAFQNKTTVTSVVIPDSVTNIGSSAFYGCSGLSTAGFLGNAPAMGTSVFGSTASGFTVNYFDGAVGFSRPTWNGYPSAIMGAAVTNPTFANVTDAAATLGGTVTSDGGYTITTRGVVYAPTSTNNGPRIGGAGVTNMPGIGTTGVFTLNVSDLMPGTAYTFAAYATNSLGTGYSATGTFTTLPSPFTFAISGGSITITGYTGAGGAVIIPSSINGLSVTSIGTSAFQSKSSIVSVTIPTSITSIGDYAFFDSSGLTSVNIPGSVTSIGSAAFGRCASLSAIMVDSTNTNFSDMDGVLFDKSRTSIVEYPGGKVGSYIVPPGVTTIRSDAFNGHLLLTGIKIPASMASIADDAFRFCTGLNAVTVDSSNPHYRSIDGVLYDKDASTIVLYPAGRSGAYDIPTGVATIGDHAFLYCRSLQSITIPHGVTSIGLWSFRYCSALEILTIPASVINIGHRSFEYCSSLDQARFLGNAPTMGIGVFNAAASGFTVNYFDGAVGFTKPTWNGYPSAVMGATVTPPTFASVTDATATLGGTVTSDGGYTITTRGVVYAPTAINNSPRIGGAGVTNMPGTGTTGVFMVNVGDLMPGTAYTFAVYATNSLGTGYSVTGTFTTLPSPFTFSISGGVVEITGYTGPGGTVDIPGKIGGQPVTRIGDNAFSYCTGLTSVTIPNSVTSIGDGAFYSCMGLTSVAIPDSVTSIGGWAFYDCAGLTSVTIPSSVSSIGDSTFDSCTGLTGVTIPNGVTSIGYGAFFNCSGLTGVTIPDSVTHIGDWAFYYCRGLKAARYMGNAPTMGKNVFAVTAGGFSVYYFAGATGFTSPPWNGYTMVNMGAPTPVTTWLVENTLPHNAVLQDDPNGDGVSLLMAYALDLDPNGNLSGSMPQPVVVAGQMSLDFHAGSAGVTYAVETSTDMVNWTREGVVISAPDANQVRTATVDMTGAHRYMRLVVVH